MESPSETTTLPMPMRIGSGSIGCSMRWPIPPAATSCGWCSHSEQSVSALAERYPMSFAAVQKHVAVLERAELIHKRRHGREQLVRGDIETLRTVNRLLDQYEAIWRSRIDQMDEILAESEMETESDAVGAAPATETHDQGETPMTVKNVEKDPATLTMVVTAEFRAPVERVWQLWADPRQLERWWGPPTYPATVVDHDLVARRRP